MPRFYFDSQAGSCLQFFYGGCQGNGNNFRTLEECQEACDSHLTPMSRTPKLSQPEADICQQNKDPGPCFALKPRFFFNSGTGACEEFIYGGCRGNGNNFQSMTECLTTCGGVVSMPGAVVNMPRSLPFPPLPPPLPRCEFGNETFAIGDEVILEGRNCQTCVCSSPPSLTCHQKFCPQIAYLPPEGGKNCRIKKDELGCCDVGYECDEPVGPPAPPPVIGGSGGVLGGFRAEEVGAEVKKVAAVATKQLLASVGGVTGGECQHAQLLEILDVARQIVAGTNFKLKLRIRVKTGPDCQQKEERICSNIVIFRPLKVYCQDTKGDCLEVIREQEIVCQ